MRRPGTSRSSVVLILLAFACVEEPTEPRAPTKLSIAVVDGDAQEGLVGAELPQPLRVRITREGQPVAAMPIHWSPNVRPLSERTDADGIAAGAWRLPTVAGEVSATARLDGSKAPEVVFRAIAVCSPSDRCARLAPLGYVRQATVLVTDFDGSEPAALADGSTRPAWSPDGSQIAFTRPTNDHLAQWQLCVARADGSEARCLVGDRNGSIVGRPAWSPDGGQVAFAMFVHSCPNGNCGQLGGFFSSLRVLNLATMKVDTVDTPPLTSVSWSPDGRRIAFTAFGMGRFGRGALGIVNPDGSELEILAPSLGSYSASEVAWSPDGRRFALALMDEYACPWYCDTAIGVAELDGSRLTVLATAQTNANRYVSWPAWSPDGTRIAYTLGEGENAGYDAVYPGSDILIVNADGGRSEVLVPGGGLPSWRP